MPVQGPGRSRDPQEGTPIVPVVPPVPSTAPVTVGPAGVGLKLLASPAEWTGSDPRTREEDPAKRFIERISREPAKVEGKDIHMLLEHGLDPKLSDSVAVALERAVRENSSLAEDVVTACHARLKKTPAGNSPVRGVVVRALAATVVATLDGSRHRAAVMEGIKNVDLTKSERAQVESCVCGSSPQAVADLRKQLPLPRWYHRVFGEPEETTKLRVSQIAEKVELICALAERGILLDEVVSLVGDLIKNEYLNKSNLDILRSLKGYVTETGSSLSGRSQKVLSDVLVSAETPYHGTIAQILLAGTVSEAVQRSLAKRLLQLKDTVPLTKMADRWVVRMCALLSERPECIKELSDLFSAAKNRWPIGAELTGRDPFLLGGYDQFFRTVDGHQAILGAISVGGKVLTTLLSEGSFNKTRGDQAAYAKRLGYRLASEEEHLAYVNDLLKKEDDNSITPVQRQALRIHMERYVRNDRGGFEVEEGRAIDTKSRMVNGELCVGALFVRESAESK